MPNELTEKQCNAYQEEFITCIVKPTGDLDNPWVAFYAGADDAGHLYGKSRQDVISRHRYLANPDWTPPVIHDAKWALRYARQHTLCFGRRRVWEAAYSNNGVNIDDGLTTVDAVLKWKAKYDPDKPEPTREETAVELLSKLRQFFPGCFTSVGMEEYNDVIRKTDTLLKDADHE